MTRWEGEKRKEKKNQKIELEGENNIVKRRGRSGRTIEAVRTYKKKLKWKALEERN
jgi:hypothetical protein